MEHASVLLGGQQQLCLCLNKCSLVEFSKLDPSLLHDMSTVDDSFPDFL